MKRIILMLALSIGASMAVAGDINTAQYDSVSGLLELPRVSVDGGKATYSVTLQNRVHSIGGYLFDLDQDTVTLNKPPVEFGDTTCAEGGDCVVGDSASEADGGEAVIKPRYMGDVILFATTWSTGIENAVALDGKTYAVTEENDWFGYLVSQYTGVTYDSISYTMPDLQSSAPANTMPYMISNGTWPPSDPYVFTDYALTDSPFVGEIAYTTGVDAPAGWAVCDGAALPISQNTALFSILGTTFGGNGYSYFNLPNLIGASTTPSGSLPVIAVLGQYPQRS